MGIREDAYEGNPVKVPVIDAHTHILPSGISGIYQSIADTKDVVALLDRLGIDCIVTAPHPMLDGMMPFANEAALEASRQFPGRIYGYISICPHDGISAIQRELDRYGKEKSFVGLKLLSGYHGELDREEYQYALDFANEAGCPVVAHIWGGAPSLKSVEAVVRTRPRMKLIMAHLGGGSAECFDSYVRLMACYPNLYTDICGSLYNRYSIEDVVEKAGETRVIFGSDLIYLDPRYDLGRILFSTLSQAAMKRLLAENYLSLLEDSQMGKISVSCRKK